MSTHFQDMLLREYARDDAMLMNLFSRAGGQITTEVLYQIANILAADRRRLLGDLIRLSAKSTEHSLIPNLNQCSLPPLDGGSRLLAFYSDSQCVDHKGRTLEEIWAFGDSRLEREHDFIQWLFPTLDPSRFNPQAPTLDLPTAQVFRRSPLLLQNVMRSFAIMLDFWGMAFDRETCEVFLTPRFLGRSAWATTPGNHNQLRITRVLKSLGLFGLRKEAEAFFKTLKDVYQREDSQISTQTLQRWADAIGETNQIQPQDHG